MRAQTATRRRRRWRPGSRAPAPPARWTTCWHSANRASSANSGWRGRSDASRPSWRCRPRSLSHAAWASYMLADIGDISSAIHDDATARAQTAKAYEHARAGPRRPPGRRLATAGAPRLLLTGAQGECSYIDLLNDTTRGAWTRPRCRPSACTPSRRAARPAEPNPTLKSLVSALQALDVRRVATPTASPPTRRRPGLSHRPLRPGTIAGQPAGHGAGLVGARQAGAAPGRLGPGRAGLCPRRRRVPARRWQPRRRQRGTHARPNRAC